MATSISTSHHHHHPFGALWLHLTASLVWLADVRVDAAWRVSAQAPENVSDNNSSRYYNASQENDLVFTDTLQNNSSQINRTYSYTNETHASGDDLVFTILTSTILGLMILATVVGNVFVIAAILLERHLHSVANYLIVSLAVADLLVACLVMPLGAVYAISQEWMLGPELCDMWTSSDVLCCTASILHLVAIAVDRYWAVTNVDYIYNRNVGRIGIMIVLVWGVSLVVSLAPLFGWKDADYLERVNIHKKCLVSQDVAYQVVATCATFYVPVTVILILYWKIFQTARKRIRRRPGKVDTTTQNTSAGPNQGCKGKGRRCAWFRSHTWLCNQPQAEAHNGDGPDKHYLPKPTDDGPTFQIVLPPANPMSEPNTRRILGDANDEPNVMETTAFTINVTAPIMETHLDSPILEPQPLLASKNGSHSQYSLNNGSMTHLCQSAGEVHLQEKPNSSPLADTSGQSHVVTLAQKEAAQQRTTVREKKETLEAKREKKAAKTLAIITGAFVVCWLPFFVCAITMPFCPQCSFDETMLSVFLWLGYFNSTLNPLLYTIFSPEFRQAFKRLLCGRTSMSSSAYRPRKLR